MHSLFSSEGAWGWGRNCWVDSVDRPASTSFWLGTEADFRSVSFQSGFDHSEGQICQCIAMHAEPELDPAAAEPSVHTKKIGCKPRRGALDPGSPCLLPRESPRAFAYPS